MRPLCACGNQSGNGQINCIPVCDHCYRASQQAEWRKILAQKLTQQLGEKT